MEGFPSLLEQVHILTDSIAVFEQILRYLLPVLALLILGRCARSLLLFHKEPEVWAWLAAPNGERLPVNDCETLLGRSKSCDVVLDYPTISRSHAVLTRYDDGSWSISDVGSKGGIEVNGQPVTMEVVDYGDVICLGGVEFQLVPITKKQEAIQASVRTHAGDTVRPGITLLLLTLFQILMGLQLLLRTEHFAQISSAFFLLMAAQWVLFGSMKALRRSGFEVETIAFFLTTLGMAVIASDSPAELTKQLVSIGAGLLLFLGLCIALRKLERAKKLRYTAAVISLLLLAANLAFGVELGGAKNWI